MKISDIRIKIQPRDNFIGYATITLDNQLVIHNIRILKGADSLFVAMPNKKIKGEDRYEDIVIPDEATKRWITKAVLTKYREMVENEIE